MGENYPGFENLCALADHFGVTLDYLAGALMRDSSGTEGAAGDGGLCGCLPIA